jgi:hypothetical protein
MSWISLQVIRLKKKIEIIENFRKIPREAKLIVRSLSFLHEYRGISMYRQKDPIVSVHQANHHERPP